MDERVNSILETELINVGKHTFEIADLVSIATIIVLTIVVMWLIRKLLFRKKFKERVDFGNIYAIYRIIKYIVWVVAIVLILDTIGLKVTGLIAGSAALLVGVGLGLQQTFNDIVSGVILLTEGSIKMGDVLEVEGDVVMIQEIGLRTSKCLNRDNISIIIPNSLITTSKVINWSHQSRDTRFKIEVGVAYGSDVPKVIQTLEESAKEHTEVTKEGTVEARFTGFGNSSLDFTLLFFSENVFRIEKVKSDIRKNIDRKFRERNITIPFPQVDLHVRSDATK